MIRGMIEISIDPKGRIAIPTRYREQINKVCAGSFVVTIDPSSFKCLLIYPTPEFEESQRKVERLPNMLPEARELQRVFIGHASDVDLDSQGRLLIPGPLRKLAGLDKSATLVGQGNKFELWDQERWNEMTNAWVNGGVLGGKEGEDQFADLSL